MITFIITAILPHTEAHACHLMVLFSHHKASRRMTVSAASHADPDLNRAILAYVIQHTSAAWWYAMNLCGYGL